MTFYLNSNDPNFEQGFRTLLDSKREDATDVDTTVLGILKRVRTEGDQALIELTRKFDGLELEPDSIAYPADDIEAAIATVREEDAAALQCAADRIRAYHEKQVPNDEMWTDDVGARLGWRWRAVGSAGLYVPGGTASYPSSVLMNAIPAQVAGVPNLVIAAPSPNGTVNPLVLLAARLAGVDTVYRIGGAQAIAALAYGTESVQPVDLITGPGNAYVAAAKRLVFGKVGIDMIAGPSEILILADADNDPDWVALDLLSQAEHDASAQAMLISNDTEFAEAVRSAVDTRLEHLERRDIARASWDANGAIITVQDWSEAVDLTDRIAPEHLEVCTANAEDISNRVRNAGAIFIGAWTPEAIGDYVGGPNHVLPTARSARFSSGLSVLDFMKRTTLSEMSPGALREIGPYAERLAKSEGLEAHGLSVRARLDRLNEPDQ